MLDTIKCRWLSDVPSVGRLWNVSVVAAEQFGIRCAEGASVSDDHQLHLTLVDVDQHRGAPLCAHEEEDGEDGHLELRACPDEGTANRLH